MRDPVRMPYLRVANVQGGHLDLAEIKRITVDRAEVGRFLLKSGDVLMTEGGDFDKLGRAAIWAGEVEPCLHQNHVFAVRCDPDKLLPEWLSIVSSSHYGRRYFQLCSKQSTNLASINSSQLKALPIPLPPRNEQAAIVALLQNVERCIASSHALCLAKGTLKRGLAQQLLAGKKRFPEFRARPWPSAKLGSHVKPVQRKNTEDCTRVLTASGEHGLVDQREFFNRRVAAADVSGYYLLRRGEFAYNRSAMNGYPYGATKRLDAHDEGVLSTLYLCFAISDDKLDSDFLRHLFDSGLLNKQLRRIVRVGARAHGLLNVSDSDFFELSIPFPAIDEQRAVAQLLDGLEREIELLSEQRDLYARYKRGLMARLLSGEIKVPA